MMAAAVIRIRVRVLICMAASWLACLMPQASQRVGCSGNWPTGLVRFQAPDHGLHEPGPTRARAFKLWGAIALPSTRTTSQWRT